MFFSIFIQEQSGELPVTERIYLLERLGKAFRAVPGRNGTSKETAREAKRIRKAPKSNSIRARVLREMAEQISMM